jgi:hypothetical protein
MLLGGCGRPIGRPADPVTVAVEGPGAFPVSLAGRWLANQHGWELEFEPNGRIAAAVISLGRVRVIPGTTTTMPTKSGDDAVFTPGLWTVHYAPDTQELTVRITMSHVRVEMGGNVVEGSSTDTFVGPIDAAAGTWQTQWTTFPRYVAHTPDRASFDLTVDPNQGETRSLTFRRAPAGQP